MKFTDLMTTLKGYWCIYTPAIRKWLNVLLYTVRRIESIETVRPAIVSLERLSFMSIFSVLQLTLDHSEVNAIVGRLFQSRVHVEQVGDVGHVELLIPRHHVLR